ncbi:MAG: phosphatidylglycerophosphate synthase [Verrucomicrobiales bacterium]|jgi:phosphatidylglycerophosphate synthase
MNGKLERLWATKNKNDEWWSSFVTSPLAIAANYLVIDFKWLTPNLVTLFSFIAACAATALIVIGGQVEFYIAAALIHISHVLDCMDGQMARYRGVSSRGGSFFDKVTDQLQVSLWFGAIGYAAYAQTGEVLPVFLAFAGVSFYGLRGYIKYVVIYTEMSDDQDYLARAQNEAAAENAQREGKAGLGHGMAANLRWFAGEQRKLLSFDEGVFIFMLSAALILNSLTPMLWIFAISQGFYGVARSLQRGRLLQRQESRPMLGPTEK